jgi:uncharacterized membrane protein HdeD (DUF308 family)
MHDPLSRPVDMVADRTGLTRDAVAILFIVAGALVILFPNFIQFVLGILLIIVGVVWLVNSAQERRARHHPPPPPPPSG